MKSCDSRIQIHSTNVLQTKLYWYNGIFKTFKICHVLFSLISPADVALTSCFPAPLRKEAEIQESNVYNVDTFIEYHFSLQWNPPVIQDDQKKKSTQYSQ